MIDSAVLTTTSLTLLCFCLHHRIAFVCCPCCLTQYQALAAATAMRTMARRAPTAVRGVRQMSAGVSQEEAVSK